MHIVELVVRVRAGRHLAFPLGLAESEIVQLALERGVLGMTEVFMENLFAEDYGISNMDLA